MKKLLNKKGMTLVEVIVVLVILAILAAVLVPTMIGWINKANENTLLAEARTVLIAAQTIVSEDFGTNGSITAGKYTSKLEKIAALAEVNVSDISVTVDASGKVTEVTYTKGGKVATYNGTSWEVEEVEEE